MEGHRNFKFGGCKLPIFKQKGSIEISNRRRIGGDSVTDHICSGRVNNGF